MVTVCMLVVMGMLIMTCGGVGVDVPDGTDCGVASPA
jgi:hypothetical protein